MHIKNEFELQLQSKSGYANENVTQDSGEKKVHKIVVYPSLMQSIIILVALCENK